MTGQLSIDSSFANPETVCVLPLNPVSEPMYVPPPFSEGQRLLAPGSISVNFLPAGQTLYGYTCSTWPAQAQTAAQFAADIWAAALTTNQSVTIDACWSSGLEANTLGSAGPSNFYQASNPPFWGPTWFPVALLEALVDANINGAAPEGQAVFNAGRSDWYYGTDGSTPFNKIDFASVFLHELGHALGFLGATEIDNGGGPQECDGVNGHGCVGFLSSGNWNPTIFTRLVELGGGSDILDQANPSAALATLFKGGTVGGETGLYLAGDLTMASNGGLPAKLYTPTTFSSGSTYSHWDQNSFSSQLMKPFLSYGQAIHNPGLALQALYDIGWNGFVPLPVTLSAWSARAVSGQVALQWTTASEHNNMGFNVQRSQNGSDWETVGWVRGEGESVSDRHYRLTDPTPYAGVNFYRLEQLDTDGKRNYSSVQTVTISVEGPTVEVYPNPVGDELHFRLPPAFEGGIAVELFDLLGRRVSMQNIQSNADVIRMAGLPTGQYLVRGRSERTGEMVIFVVVSRKP